MWIWMHVSKCCRHIRLHIFMFVASFFFVLTKSKLSLFTPTFMTTCSFYCLARPPWLASRQQSSVGLPWPWLGATCRRLGITAPSVDDYRGSNLQWSTVFFSVVLICFDIVLTIKIIKHQMGSSNGDQRSTNIIIGCCDFRFLLTNILGPNHHLYVFSILTTKHLGI